MWIPKRRFVRIRTRIHITVRNQPQENTDIACMWTTRCLIPVQESKLYIVHHCESILFFESPPRSRIYYFICTALTVRYSAPQNTLWRGPWRRFEPGTGGQAVRTHRPQLHHISNPIQNIASAKSVPPNSEKNVPCTCPVKMLVFNITW